MPTKKTKTVKSKKSPNIVVYCGSKKATMPNDTKAPDKIRDFVVSKMRIGAFQLLTQPDESGKVVRLDALKSFKGTNLYVRERNKAQ